MTNYSAFHCQPENKSGDSMAPRRRRDSGQPGEVVVRRTRQPCTPLAAVAERPGLLHGYGQAALVHWFR